MLSPRLFRLTCALPLALLALHPSASFAADARNKVDVPPDAARLQIKVTPFGPTQADLDGLAAALPEHPQLKSLFAGSRVRFFFADIVDADQKDGAPVPPTRFRAVFYNYTKQQTVLAEGLFSDLTQLDVSFPVRFYLAPTQAEFDEAVSTLLADRTLGPGIVDGSIVPYWPMPPVLEIDPATGKAPVNRIVNVGLMPKVGLDRYKNQIVGIDLAQQSVRHYEKDAPPTAIVNASPNCGVPAVGQGTSSKGLAGQYQLTVIDPLTSTTLWTMLVVRPSASSGTKASGIEVRDVFYKGFSVLKRGHVPILNVKYVNDACGPYRDWQYQEGMFATTPVSDPAAGFRDCGTNVATTALENGTDTGNFKGVAIYRQGTEVVMVTEMEAGWYRYIHEWRFDMDGSIRPRFGFGATSNGCTCLTHTHHVYFRLDVDIESPTNTIYQIPIAARDISDKPSYAITTEKKLTRSATQQFLYRIRGPKRSYILTAGKNDGSADTYARGDMWFLKYKTGGTPITAEIDDGVSSTGGATEANLDQFLTGESLLGQDVVIWYHANVTHSPTINSAMCTPTGLTVPGRNILTGDNVVGPDLSPEEF